MNIRLASRTVCCAILWTLLAPLALAETAPAQVVPDGDLLELLLPEGARLVAQEDGVAAVELGESLDPFSVPAARPEGELADLASAVTAMKSALATSGLTPLGRTAVKSVLERLLITEQPDPDSAELTPRDARMLVASGWLGRILPESAAASELRSATQQAMALAEIRSVQLDSGSFQLLANAFGSGTWVSEADGTTRYALRLPPPAYYPEARSMLLMVELTRGAALPADDGTLAADDIAAARVYSPDGEPTAWWTDVGGFGSEVENWRKVYPELEGAALPGLVPPHVLLSGPAGTIHRLITEYGQLAVAAGGDPDEVERFTSDAAAALPDAAHLDLLGQFLFRYVFDSPDPTRPQLVGGTDAHGEIHQTVSQTLATTTAGVCRGDCDDLAELYHTIASKQDHVCHIMSVPAHNALCWAEQVGENRWHAFVLHTGVPLALPGNDLAEAIERTYGLFIEGETFDTDSVPIALRFAGENQRDTWLLSHRIFAEREYARTMIDVQRDWHYMTYYRAILKMLQLLEDGDRHPANYKELAGLASRTGQHALAALCHRTGLLVDPDVTPVTLVRLLDAYLEAGDLAAAGQLTEDLLQRELPTAKVCMEAMEYRDLVLMVAATLIDSGRQADQAADLLVAEVTEPMESFIGQVGRWMKGKKFKMSTWEQGGKPMKLREHVLIYGGLVTLLLRDEELRQQVDGEVLARLRQPLDAWFESVAFQHPLDSGDLLRNYGLLGELQMADVGVSQFELALASAPPPDPDHDHAARAADGQGQELAWINASPLFWSGEESWLTREEAKTLDRDRFLEVCDRLGRARATALELGHEDYALDQVLAAMHLPQALVTGDTSLLRRRLVELAEQGDKRLIDSAVTAIGSLARFLEPQWFAQVLALWKDEVGTKPSYFGIAWQAYRSHAPDHALMAAELGVEAFPDETAFTEELTNLKHVVVGEETTGMQIPMPDAAWWQGESEEGAEPINGRGVHLVLPGGWIRRSANPDVQDQFFLEPDVWAIVYEVEACLESAADFAVSDDLDFLDEDDNVLEVSPITYHPRIDGGLGHRYYRSGTDDEDVELFWSVSLVARDGLGIMVVVWSTTGLKEQVLRNAPRLVAGVRFPGPDTEWGRSTRPVRLAAKSAGMTFSLEHPPSLLPAMADEDLGDAILGLRAPGNAISMYALTGTAASSENMLDEIVALLARSNDDLERLTTSKVTIDGREALRTDIRFGERGRSGVLCAVPLRDDRYLDLRFFTRGSVESRSQILHGLLSSLTLDVPEPVVAFPAAATAPDPLLWSGSWQQLVDRSEKIAEVSGWPTVSPHGAGEALIASDEGLSVLSLATGAIRALELGDVDADLEEAIFWGDGVRAIGADEAVLRLGDDGWEPLGFTAKMIASAGNHGLLAVRQAAPGPVPGMLSLPAVAPRELLLRSAEGDERVVTTLPADRGIVFLTTDGPARHVLVCSTSARPGDDDTAQALAVDLESGDTLGSWTWEAIHRVVPSAAGWLITGELLDGTWGVFELAVGSEPRLLVRSRSTNALEAADEHLVLFARPPGASLAQILRVPRAAVAELGPACEPFDSPRLRELALAALAATGLEPTPRGALGDGDRLDLLIDAARELAAAGGSPLPRDDLPAVEAILRGTVDTSMLGEEGLLLEAAIAADALLAVGAEWVPAGDAGISATRSVLPVKNYHAVAYAPHDWVSSDSHWTSVGSIQRSAGGRKILLGIDPVTLAKRVSELDDGRGDDLAVTGSAAEVTAFLASHPDNVFLREALYDRIAAHGRLQVLHQVASALTAHGPSPTLADDRARLATAVALALDKERYTEIVTELKDAISQHGATTSSFHLLLGQVYERGDEPRARDLARACYDHTARQSDSPELVGLARAGLERLEE